MHDARDIEEEYHDVLCSELRRWGIPESCASVDVRQVAIGAGGCRRFAGVIRLQTWERTPVLTLLLGMPFLQKKLRQTLRTRWISEVSEFEGVWLNASERMLESAGVGELRQLLVALTGADAPVTQPSGLRQNPSHSTQPARRA